MSSILEDSIKGFLPELNQEHRDRIRRHLGNGMEVQWLELLQSRNATQKAKKARGRMGPPTPNLSPSPWSMVTPPPKFFSPDHPSSATFKEPSPGGAMGPPPSPAPDSRTPAASITQYHFLFWLTQMAPKQAKQWHPLTLLGCKFQHLPSKLKRDPMIFKHTRLLQILNRRSIQVFF